MSADRLREAARVLRERAEAATSPPWEARPGPLEGHWVAGLGGMPCRPIPGLIEDEDAAYIATMHPGVGLALADWLDGAASNAEFMQAVIDTGRADNPDASLARTKADDVADLILGSAS